MAGWSKRKLRSKYVQYMQYFLTISLHIKENAVKLIDRQYKNTDKFKIHEKIQRNDR